jgi:hypothetical protein
MTVMNAADDKAGLARNLGRFFGHLWKGARADVKGGRETRVLRRETEEEVVQTSRGAVTVRRTVIEEVEAPARRGDE